MTSTAFQLAQILTDLYKVTNQVCVHRSLVNADEIIVSAAHYWYGSKERNPDTLKFSIKPDSFLTEQRDFIEFEEAVEFSLKEIEEEERIEAVKKEALSKLSDEEKEALGL